MHAGFYMTQGLFLWFQPFPSNMYTALSFESFEIQFLALSLLFGKWSGRGPDKIGRRDKTYMVKRKKNYVYERIHRNVIEYVHLDERNQMKELNKNNRVRERERIRRYQRTRPSQEVKKDTAVSFTDIPPRVKVWNWRLWTGGEGSRAGRLLGPHCSQLKQCQPVGFQLGGKAALCAKLARAPSSKFQPTPAQPKTQVSSVLWQWWNEGLLRGHEVYTPTTHSAGTAARKKRRSKAGIRGSCWNSELKRKGKCDGGERRRAFLKFEFGHEINRKLKGAKGI